MKNYLIIALLLIVGACSEEETTSPIHHVPTMAHDTIEIHNPPAAGGTLAGSWKAQPDGVYWLTSQGLRGYSNVLYFTDLRIDGSRVWFEAWEIGTASEKITFNGTKSDSLIDGWFSRQLRLVSEEWSPIWGYKTMTFHQE